MYISDAVGAGGINKRADVKFIQALLSELAAVDFQLDDLSVDGVCGKKTKIAIGKFQQVVVKLKKIDQKVDVDGRTEKTLIGKLNELDKSLVGKYAKEFGLRKAGGAVHNEKGPKQIIYRANAKRVLSAYTQNVIKLAMGYGGINRCDISSTLRTFDDQARIMYNNCKRFPGATSVTTLRSKRGWGYAAAGRSVEEVYFAKKSEGEDTCKKAMREKIASLYKEGKKVSLHCVSESDFKKKNVLDIPYSSVIAGKKKDFEIALMGMTREIKNIRYKKPIQGDIYIDRLIIEDKCWHLEIPQNEKTLTKSQAPIEVNECLVPEYKVQTLEGSLNRLLRFIEKLI